MRRGVWKLGLLLGALAACSEDRAAPIATPPAAPAAASALASSEPLAGPPPTAATRAPDDGGAIHFGGFGAAAFGSDAATLRAAWGDGLAGDLPANPAHCHYLQPAPRPHGGYGTAFMFEDARFVRVDVDSPDIAAPGGGRIGMQTDEIAAIYAGRIETRPHEYVPDGRYLRVRDDDGRPGVLLFETDADGRVTRWRVGLAPQVDYSEGCS